MSDGKDISLRRVACDTDSDEVTDLFATLMNVHNVNSLAELIKVGGVTFDEDGTIKIKIDADKYVNMRRFSIGPLRGDFLISKYWHLKSRLGITLSEPMLPKHRVDEMDTSADDLTLSDDAVLRTVTSPRSIEGLIQDRKDKIILYIHLYLIDQHNNILELTKFSEADRKEIVDEILADDRLDILFHDFKIEYRDYNDITKILQLKVRLLKSSPSYELIRADATSYLMEYYNEFAKDTWMQDDTRLTLQANHPLQKTHVLRFRFGLTLMNAHLARPSSTSMLL